VNCRPFLNHRFSYSFGDLQSQTQLIRLIEFCHHFDHWHLAESFVKLFSVQIPDIILTRVPALLIQGAYDEVLRICTFPFDDSRVPEIRRVLLPITHMSIFDAASFGRIEACLAQSPTGPNLPKSMLQQIVQPARTSLSPALIGQITQAVCARSITAHAELRHFSSAFGLLMEIDRTARVDRFISSIFENAVASRPNIAKLEKYIKAHDPNLEQTGSLWAALSDYALSRQMFHILFHINFAIRNHFELAASAALELFDLANRNELRLSYLSHAKACLLEAIGSRRSSSEPEPGSLPDLQAVLLKVDYLQSVLEFCTERDLPFLRDYNILKGKPAGMALGVFFMLHGAEEFTKACCALMNIREEEVPPNAALSLAKLPSSELVAFLLANLKILPPPFLDLVLRTVVKTANRDSALVIISCCWTDPADQCTRFLECGLIPEAFGRAVDHRFRHLLPLIAYHASLLGQVEICASCEKALS
jgi:hypothetical protein